METFEATIEDITYQNPENGYFVGRMSARGQSRFTAVGTLFNAQQGARLTIEGGWTEHPTYGRQFKFETAQLIEQTPLDALRSYLASGRDPRRRAGHRRGDPGPLWRSDARDTLQPSEAADRSSRRRLHFS